MINQRYYIPHASLVCTRPLPSYRALILSNTAIYIIGHVLTIIGEKAVVAAGREVVTMDTASVARVTSTGVTLPLPLTTQTLTSTFLQLSAPPPD